MIPSSSGTPAATSEPKAMTRMISVIGSESIPGLLEVVGDRLVDRLCWRWRRRTARREAGMVGLDGGDRGERGSTRCSASVESPPISNSTSAA